jgi:transketolase
MSISYQELEWLARELRFRTIRTSHLSGTPHLGSCLSCVDLLIYLYWAVLKISPRKPRDAHRDRFILSKGHAAPVLFQVLAERGFFSVDDLEHYGENGSIFGEHPPAPKYLPGIEAATGSLGHGLPMGVGMALAAHILGADYRTFVVLSDGECNEGSVWEAALMAAAQKLHSLTVFVDYNKWQATGRSNDVLGLAPLADKWAAFGWFVHEIDGHDFSAIEAAVAARDELKRPKIIVAHTVKGKGVTFMEDDNNWHYRIPTADEVRKAAVELQIPAESIRLDGLAPRTHE